MLILRLYEQQQQIIDEREFFMGIKRIEIADFRNVHRGNSSVITPQDIFKLSYDTKINKEPGPNMFARVAKRLGGVIKKKKGDE